MIVPVTSLKSQTMADLLEQLGGVPPERVLVRPAPGTATEKDVIRVHDKEGRLCELVDGVLVEKTVGWYESRVAIVLSYFVEAFLETHDLGIALGADGTFRLMPGLVRIPDVAFVSWDQLPNRELPAEPIPDLAPDLAVEVLSASNTKREMDRKVGEYFRAGVRLVWLIDPQSRTAVVYTSPRRRTLVAEGQALNGGSVLSGFSLSLKRLFARAGRRRGR
jgi:Uma2 family endonuclease